MSFASILREHTACLHADLAYGRGQVRVEMAAATVRSVRRELESHEGDDVAAMRELLAALEAAHRTVDAP